MNKRIFLATFLFLAFSLSAAEGIRCAGILGNSGEQGPSLIRFSEKSAAGIGVVSDRFASLWDRGGDGVLNRYALDGRLLASYKIPTGATTSHQNAAIALLGDTVIIRLDGGIFTLPVDAPSGAAAKSLNIPADLMSLAAQDGWLAASKGAEVFLFNAAGEKKPVATLKKSPEQGLGLGGDGTVHVILSGKLHRIAADAPDKVVLEGSVPAERMQFLNGYWYGHGHHSTIRRFDTSFQPAPGVIMGGNSGAFIGHVDEQAEVVDGRGLAQITPNLFAVSGAGGILHLLEWKASDVRFEPVRRIGAVASCDALALDRDGRIWFKSGNWNWDDGPATPLHYGVPEPEKIFALTTHDSGAAAGYGIMWGKPTVMFGKLDKEVRLSRIEAKTDLPAAAVATAITTQNKKQTLLILQGDGRVSGAYIADDGKFLGDAGPVELRAATPVKVWTSLAAAGRDSLLAAGDGFVIEFARDGDNWKESQRWNSWGQEPGKKFGERIFLSADSGRIWISDTARHRIVCLLMENHELIGEFGQPENSGDDLTHLNAPKVIAARGQRAVVFDSGNQRIVKLNLAK